MTQGLAIVVLTLAAGILLGALIGADSEDKLAGVLTILFFFASITLAAIEVL